MHSRFIITTLLIISFSACVLVSANPARAATVNLARFERAKEHFRRGVIFFNNNQYLAAVEFFRKAIAEYPEYHTAREYLARAADGRVVVRGVAHPGVVVKMGGQTLRLVQPVQSCQFLWDGQARRIKTAAL